MKTLFLLSALACSSIAQAQDKPVKPSLKNLEEKYGFRDAHFEADTTEFSDLIPVGHFDAVNGYTRSGDSKKIGGADIDLIRYSFYKGKLFRIVIRATGYSNSQALLAALVAQYGPGEKLYSYREHRLWTTKRVMMSWEQEAGSSNGEVVITSEIVSNRRKADQAATAKKAASDL
jgi:hypothetical protein